MESLLLSSAESQTVNAMSYQVFVGSPAPINAEKLLLFHYRCSTNDKTCCQVARPVKYLLEYEQWKILEPYPYSLEISPSDSELFQKMKKPSNVSSSTVWQKLNSRTICNRHWDEFSVNGSWQTPKSCYKVLGMAGDYINGMKYQFQLNKALLRVHHRLPLLSTQTVNHWMYFKTHTYTRTHKNFRVR
jgi:hypothetical protein